MEPATPDRPASLQEDPGTEEPAGGETKQKLQTATKETKVLGEAKVEQESVGPARRWYKGTITDGTAPKERRRGRRKDP